LLDANGDFYFIEMNTRLQVEHGVTEAITGIDLVQWQLRIASGEHLTLQQDNITFFGHAIQGRLCAEDPARDFMPQTGPVLAWRPDENSRCDHALQEGGEVSPWYDSLLAKVIVHGENRLAACEKLADSLKRTVLIGFEHNALYLQRIASHPVFQGGDFGTGFLAQHADELLKPQHFMAECAVAAVFLAYAQQQNHAAWPTPLTGFSSTRALPRPLKLKVQGKSLNLKVSSNNNSYEVDGLGDEAVVLEHWQCMTTQQGSVTIQSMVNDQSAQYTVTQSNSGVWVQQGLNPQALHVDDETLLSASALAEGVFQAVVSSPMNGKVTQVLVQPGQQVEAGTVLVCLEAMKMEHRISAKTAAIVEQVHIKVGDQMKQKQAMVQLSPIQ
jgi:geranyl-CoA carboxylase alpha subunit